MFGRKKRRILELEENEAKLVLSLRLAKEHQAQWKRIYYAYEAKVGKQPLPDRSVN